MNFAESANFADFECWRFAEYGFECSSFGLNALAQG